MRSKIAARSSSKMQSVISVKDFPGEQFIIRLTAPRTAANATPGSFVHVQCDETIPMRRPLSIMRANPVEGWIEVLFKVVGEGLRALAQKQCGDVVSIIGPIGHGFNPTRRSTENTPYRRWCWNPTDGLPCRTSERR